MSSDLYRQQVLQHARAPVNRRINNNATIKVRGDNPLCGDQLDVYVCTCKERIDDVSFEGSACAISIASASMMSTMLSGQRQQDVADTTAQVLDMLNSDPQAPIPGTLQAQPVAALAAVRHYPSRVKCATLPWQAAAEALAGGASRVTTETNNH
ncbi:MAG: Fe-S cluster assembly sulfur transfer protein SufU [Pseudomonadota bacterium]